MQPFPAYDGPVIDAHMHPGMEPDPGRWYWDPGSARRQVEDLRRAGIQRACGSALDSRPVTDFGVIRALNDKALRLRDEFPDFFIPGIHVHPRYPDESCAELRRCVEGHGVRWIGELVGYMMGYGNGYLDPGFEPIYALAADLQVPIDFHCGDVQVVDELCARFPRVRFVLAHPGDGQACRERVALVARHTNLHLDLSGTGVMRLGMIRYALDVAGAEKILLGTDFPICNPAMYVQCVLYEPLTGAERRSVLAGNFLRLIGEGE